MPRPFLVFSQSCDPDCWYKFTYPMANSADPDQKPTDLDLHCFQRQDISRFSRNKVNINKDWITNLFLNVIINTLESDYKDVILDIRGTMKPNAYVPMISKHSSFHSFMSSLFKSYEIFSLIKMVFSYKARPFHGHQPQTKGLPCINIG